MGDIVVGIDTGGTFTDGFFTDGRTIQRAKVDTTPHDLTQCLFNCLREGAIAFGFLRLQDFLREVRVLRFSSTVGTNTFAQHNGSKVGLLVSEGDEANLYGSSENAGLLQFLVSRDFVVGLNEEVDESGRVVRPVDKEEVLKVTQRLLNLGSRVLVVSLRNSHLNPVNEQTVRQILGTYYPRHYLGSLPVVIASRFCNRPNEVDRTNLSVMDAYIHRKLAHNLYKAEDGLRDLGYRRPLLIVGNNGGCTRVAKTRAIDTVGSSPVAGYLGSQFWARKYGLAQVVTFDMGGTTLDCGVLSNGVIARKQPGELFDVEVGIPLIEVSSIGLGGGSIAKVDRESGALAVGPQSAGSLPGPACYDLGGDSATVTDADVVLGRIDPDFFLNGRRKLNRASAVAALKRNIAEPLGVDLEDAALEVVDAAANTGAKYIRGLLGERGIRAAEVAIFAYGGAGSCHCCEIAERLGVRTVFTFPFSAAFGAFGTSMMDVVHEYTSAVPLPMKTSDVVVLDRAIFNKIVGDAQREAVKDMAGEGFGESDISWELELEANAGGDEGLVLFSSPKVLLSNDRDTEELLGAFEHQALSRTVEQNGNATLQLFHLTSSCPLFKYEFPENSVADGDPYFARKSSRRLVTRQGVESVEVYDATLLRAGNAVVGPAVIESSDTTTFIPSGWTFKVDKFLNGVLHRG